MRIVGCHVCMLDYDTDKQEPNCPHVMRRVPENKQAETITFTPKPAPKFKVRVVTSEGWFDLNRYDGFDMHMVVRAIRGDGYLINEMVYIPVENIRSIFVYPVDAPPPGDRPGVVLPFGGGKPA